MIYPNAFHLEPWPFNAFAASSSAVINATNSKVCIIFQAPATGAITSVSIQLGTVTAGQSLNVSLQDVVLSGTGKGYPDGTVDQSTTIATPVSNTTYACDFGAGRAVTAGDYVGVIIEWTSTPGTSVVVVSAGASNLASATATVNNFVIGTSSWARAYKIPMIAVAYGTTFHPMPNCFPGRCASLYTYRESTASPNFDEVMLKSTAPYKRQCLGIAAALTGAPDGVVTLNLYDASFNVLASGTLDMDMVDAGSTASLCYVAFATPVELTANATYYASVTPNNSYVTLYGVTEFATGALRQIPGSEYCSTYKRRDGANGVEDATTLPFIYFMIAAESGGGIPLATF